MQLHLKMARPTPMKDAAVNCLAKSITQLTLCQVTTSEVDAATKLLDKACQKLQSIQNIPSQRVTDLEAAIRQLRQINCILDSCTISASYEVSEAQKASLLLPHTAKEQAHYRKSSMHKYRHALTMSMIFHTMKIFAGALGCRFFCTPQRWSHETCSCMISLTAPHSGGDGQLSVALGLSSKHHQS